MKKNILFVTLFFAVVMLIPALSYGYAAMVAYDEETNDLAVATEGGQIVEKFTPPSVSTPISPGDTYQKVVQITNEEASPFFVRVLLNTEIIAQNQVHLPGEIGKDVLLDISDEWLLGEDGYYYYLGKVSPGEVTPPLFKTATLSDQLPEEYDQSTMRIHVKSETIIAVDSLYKSAWWPEGIESKENLNKVDAVLGKIK